MKRNISCGLKYQYPYCLEKVNMVSHRVIIPTTLISIILLVPFSPISSIFLCVIFSLFLPTVKNKYLILFILSILSFDLAVIYSAKNFHGTASDFEIYYQFYQNILHNKSENIVDVFFKEGNHFEPLYYITNTTISLLLGESTEINFSIIFNFISIYSIAISIFIYSSKFTIKNLLFLIVLTLFISKIGSITLFWRQSLSAAFIILFLSYNGYKKYIFLFIAIGFHISSIVVAPLCYLILKKKKSNFLFIFLIIIAFFWPIFGKNILLLVGYILNPSKNYFFTNNMDYPYFLDTLKTIVFSVPIILLYRLQTIKKEPDPIFYTLLLEILILIAFATTPHFFRIIYPISVVIIYLHTVILMLKLKNISFVFSLFFIILINFFRLTSDELSFQFPLYSLSPFYYLYT